MEKVLIVYVKTMCSYRIGVIIKVSTFPKSVEDHAQKRRTTKYEIRTTKYDYLEIFWSTSQRPSKKSFKMVFAWSFDHKIKLET